MKWTGLNELRETFLRFYEDRAHTRLPSYSLVPQDDKSLLLINSGMAPMKKFFMGELTPPNQRVTTCQKCIRNNDIENVGHTSRHLTYFEMLGNFSFGDYFKEQAIEWAWEFFHKELSIPKDILYISVYLEDQDAYDIWVDKIGIAPSHMVKLGKEDNFWEHGSGPCGPCSEIYFDRGETAGCGKPDCKPGCDCDRFVEVGNIVFSQFESDGKGTYTPMAKPNIDFGMGLERLACVIQGVDTVFQVDTMENIRKAVERYAGVKHGMDEKKDVSLKIITDHIRSITFMVGDGVLGSNEGRGYVLRRLIRRAARHGKQLNINGAFLYEIAKTVIAENKTAYPELSEKQETICSIIKNEEENFGKTIDLGLEMLGRLIKKVEKGVFSGDNAFLLNDTYGFPLELTNEILAERGIHVDEKRFWELMERQKERARNARKNAGADAWAGAADAAEGLSETVFTGYRELKTPAQVACLIGGGSRMTEAAQGDDVTLVLDKTPFYAQSGGQVADTGLFEAPNGAVEILHVEKNAAGVILHHGRVKAGVVSDGDLGTAVVEEARRMDIMRNHTAAHLLQAALRDVLGEHVEQAGQLVDEERVRFDFTHFSAIDQDALKEIEARVNEKIFEALPVEMREMPIEEAKQLGAMALFGEKYGEVVRVVSVGEFSKEFCGGTHVSNTARLGMFRIVSEGSVAAGVRRIEGVTGRNVLKRMEGQEALLRMAAASVKVGMLSEVPARIAQMMTEYHNLQKENERLNGRLAEANLSQWMASAKDVNGVKVVTTVLNGASVEMVKAMCDKIRDKGVPIVAVVAAVNNEKNSLAATVSKDVQAMGVKAGQLVKEVAMRTGGNGGGKPDFAMAGVKDPTKLEAALLAVPDIVSDMMTK